MKEKKILNFFSKKKYYQNINVEIKTLYEYLNLKLIKKIDFLKIDTEGHEYFVLKGFKDDISNIKVIFFEHHYDQMIMKNYTFSDIHKYLKDKNFKQNSKFKMPFRKSFEYIYINNKYL